MEVEPHRRPASAPGNLFFPPYGVAAASSMVRAGAAGKTNDEPDQALGPADTGALGKELAPRTGPAPVEKTLFRGVVVDPRG